MLKNTFKSISEIAALAGENPKRVSDLFYTRKLDVNQCPVVNGRRIIPDDYVKTAVQIVKSNRKSRA